MSGLFKFRTGDKETKSKDTTTEAQRLAAMAARCLGMPEFREYADRYIALEREIIDEMIKDARMFSADQSTLEKFGGKCLIKLIRIYDLRSLLMSVTNDAKKDKGADNGRNNGNDKEQAGRIGQGQKGQ